MSQTAVSKVESSNVKRYVENSHEREIAIKRSEEIARNVYELSFVEEYEPLKSWEDTYEISRKYPHKIRKIKGKYAVKESYNDDGYPCLNLNNGLNRSMSRKHDLIAIQWIYNDKQEYKKVVDHVNHIRDDNRIENLIWSTQSANCRNKSSHLGIEYEFIEFDDLSDEAIEFTDYGNHQFEDYIYDPETDNFYYYTGDKCRKLHVNIVKKTGALFVYTRDINNNRVQVCYNKFKKLYGFI